MQGQSKSTRKEVFDAEIQRGSLKLFKLFFFWSGWVLDGYQMVRDRKGMQTRDPGSVSYKVFLNSQVRVGGRTSETTIKQFSTHFYC